MAWHLPQWPHWPRKPFTGSQPWLTCRASESMGNMPWANFAFMTKWVTYSICPFWTGTRRYPNGLGDCNHMILLSDVCYGDEHRHLSPGGLGASKTAAGIMVQRGMSLHQLRARSGPWHSADGPLSCPSQWTCFCSHPSPSASCWYQDSLPATAVNQVSKPNPSHGVGNVYIVTFCLAPL